MRVVQRSQLLHKIKQLEQETAGPERRQAAKARQAVMKEVQQMLSEPGKTFDEKVAYMEGIFAKQVWRTVRLRQHEVNKLHSFCKSVPLASY